MGYYIFCIGEAQSDLQGMDLLIYPISSFGPNRSGLRFGLVSNDAWVLRWALHSFGLGEWDGEPIFLTPSVAPQPLCTDCVGKGCNSSCNG